MIGLSIVGYAVLEFLGFFKPQKAGIYVDSEPKATVYINGLEVGKTPFETDREPGEILVQIKPEVDQGSIYDDYETKVDLTPGVKTIIKRSFNESEDKSSGAIVSFEHAGATESLVTVVSIPDNSQVTVDDRVYGYTPIRISLSAGDHKLVVSSKGYLDKQLPIKVYRGYKLTASVKLGLDQESQTETPKKEDLSIKPRVKIKKSDTGFVRVRSGAGTGFPEISQVKPDEVYELLETGERGKWYKIQIVRTTNSGATDVLEGWVSADFAVKI